MARGLGDSVSGASLDHVLLGVGLLRKHRELHWEEKWVWRFLLISGAERGFVEF